MVLVFDWEIIDARVAMMHEPHLTKGLGPLNFLVYMVENLVAVDRIELSTYGL